MQKNETIRRIYAERFKKYRTERPNFLSGVFWLQGWLLLHDLRHKAAHGFRRLVLHLPGGVGVGAEREARVVVTQHTGDRLDIHAVLQGKGCEGVSEVVEPDVL